MEEEIFSGKIAGSDIPAKLVYVKEDNKHSRKYYTLLRTHSKKLSEQWEKSISVYKDEKAGVYEGEYEGRKAYYAVYPTSFLMASLFMLRTGKTNEKKNPPSFTRFVIDDFKDRSDTTKIVTKATAASLAIAALVMGSVAISKNHSINVDLPEPTVAVAEATAGQEKIATPQTQNYNYTSAVPFEEPTPVVTEVEDPEPVREYVDYNTLDYETWTNSAGNEIIELADALHYADVCFNNVCMDLERYNASVPENKRYSIDMNKFKSTMYIGKEINETSLFDTEKMDRSKAYRGPFQIGDAAAEEANRISLKLTGKKILETNEDFFNPVKACLASIYIDIQNNEYLEYYFRGNDIEITSEMVHDSYNKGANAIAKKVLAGEYEPSVYPLKINAYAEILDKYSEELKAGNANGSHDKIWSKIYSELYSVNEQSVLARKNAETGEMEH